MARPRSEKARQSVLDAMRTLLVRDGYDAVTVEGIANLAEVSKQTIYRWWPSKADILAEALLDGDIPGYTADLTFTDDLAADLRSWLRMSTTHLGHNENTNVARALIAVTASNPEIGEPLNRRFAGPIVAAMISRIDAARESGAIRSEVNAAALADVMLAVTSYAALQGRPVSEAHIDTIIDALLNGIAAS